jgi:DNA repair protein RadA/Sms
MPKSSTIFFCTSCGNEFPKWAGQCPACKEWNTLTEADSLMRSPKSGAKSKNHKPAESFTIKEALSSQNGLTFSTGISEFDRVLGPGLTRGGVYLMAGQPGIGKSTLLTQLALNSKTPVIYVCSEENPSQVATRIKRLSNKDNDNIHLLNTSCVEDVLSEIPKHKDSLVIVDSIQSVYTSVNATTPGSPSQVRDSATYLIQAAKESGVPMIIVGHVTKEGSIAGPKMLEHMVDTVLELSGDRQYLLRLLRTLKNRFGPTDETGIFQMGSNGLEQVLDPSKLLLEGRLENTPGSALTMIMEGTRPLTVEIQALIVPSPIPIPRRIAKGISSARLQVICAILTKHSHLPLGEKDVFVNVTGGMDIKDPGADLGIALAIISSTKNKSLPSKTICFGELGLLGEIRNVAFTDKMVKEAQKLGYKNVVSPLTHHTLKDILL